MSISSEVRKAGPYNGNDVTTSFPFSFKVFAVGDMVVVRTSPAGVETVLTGNGTDYGVTLNADQDTAPGGSIVLPAALASGYLLTVSSSVPNLQPVVLTNNGGFYPKVINDAFDRLTILTQQVVEIVSRTLKFPISDGTVNPTLPSRDLRKGRVLAFHETTGDPVQGPDIASVGTVAGNVTAINTVAGIAPNVTTVAGIAPNVTTVAGIAPNVTTVAGGITNGVITVVATHIIEVGQVAGIAESVTTVANSVIQVGLVAPNINSVVTVAGGLASVASCAANMAAIIAAPAQASSAATSAAAALVSQNAAAASAAYAAASEANAVAQASSMATAQLAAVYDFELNFF